MKKIKFNLIDAVIIAALAVTFIVFGYFAFGGWEISEENTDKTMDYTIEIRNVPEEYLNKINVGDEVFDVKESAAMGKVTAVGEPQPFENIIEDKENGAFVKTQMPESYMFTVTIRTPYRETETGYYVNDDTEIKVGKAITIKTAGLASDAVVLKLEKGAAE